MFTMVKPISTSMAPMIAVGSGRAPFRSASDIIARGIVIDMPIVATVGDVSTTALILV